MVGFGRDSGRAAVATLWFQRVNLLGWDGRAASQPLSRRWLLLFLQLLR